jgi:hypothetical protein
VNSGTGICMRLHPGPYALGLNRVSMAGSRAKHLLLKSLAYLCCCLLSL